MNLVAVCMVTMASAVNTMDVHQILARMMGNVQRGMTPFIVPVNPVTMETPVSTHVKRVTMASTVVRSVCAKMAHVME